MISNDLKKDLLLTNGACALVRRRVSDPRAGEVGAVTDVWPSRQARGGYRLTLAFSKDTLKRNYDAGAPTGRRYDTETGEWMYGNRTCAEPPHEPFGREDAPGGNPHD